jgi:tRNA 2-thiouridine synthesizing protein C
MKTITILLTRSPFESASFREGIEMAMAMAAVEHHVTVLYQGAAVTALTTPQVAAPEVFGCKNILAAQRLFNLYDINAAILVSAAATFGITEAATTIDLDWLSDIEAHQMINASDIILSY